MTASRLFLLPRRRASWQPVVGSLATIVLGLLLGSGGTVVGVLELFDAAAGRTTPAGAVWWAAAVMGVIVLLLGLMQVAVGGRELVLTMRYRRERALHADWQALGSRRFDVEGATPEGADGLLNMFGAGLCALMAAPMNLIVVAATSESAGYGPGLPEIGMSYTGLAIMAVPFVIVLDVAAIALAWSGIAAVAQDAKPRRGLFLAFSRFPFRLGQPLRASLAMPESVRGEVRRVTVRLMGGSLAALVMQLKRSSEATEEPAESAGSSAPSSDTEDDGSNAADSGRDGDTNDNANDHDYDYDYDNADVQPGDADLIDIHTATAYRRTFMLAIDDTADGQRDIPVTLDLPSDAPAGDWFLSVILHDQPEPQTPNSPARPPLARALFRLPVVPR